MDERYYKVWERVLEQAEDLEKKIELLEKEGREVPQHLEIALMVLTSVLLEFAKLSWAGDIEKDLARLAEEFSKETT